MRLSGVSKQSLKTRLFWMLCTLVMTVLVPSIVMAAENNSDAKRFYEDVVRVQPKNGNAHFDLANVYLVEKRYNDALVHYGKAARLGLAAARMDSYYFNLSVCYTGLGDMEHAVQSLEKCIKANPANQEAKNLLEIYRAKLSP